MSLAAAAIASPWAFAQPTPVTPVPPSTVEESTVELPTFEIKETPTNPYLSRRALSASRVAMNLEDIPQTVSVVTAEFIQDSLSPRMLDAAKYITPVVENTLPFGGDRYTIRGFQVSHEFIDGTEISGFGGYSMSLAPYNIERLEIIKGPNAILVPGGNPGGQINPITKSPIAKDQASLTLELAQYYGNDVNFDINRVLNQDRGMAVRLVGAYWRNDYYIKNQYRNGYMIAPSFSIQLTPSQKLVIKSEFVQNRETNGVGIPVDPAVGSNDTADILPGFDRDFSVASDMDTRHRDTERVTAELLSTLGEHVTSRLFLMGDHVRRYDVGSGSFGVTNAGGGSRNPFTGLYEPGVNWTVSPDPNNAARTIITSTNVPITAPSTWVFTRNTGREDIEYNEVHAKNDYAIKYNTDWINTTTITGWAANGVKVHRRSYPSTTRPSFTLATLDSITYPDWQYRGITPGTNTQGNGLDLTARDVNLQLYLFETLGAWQDRVQVSGGISRFYGSQSRTDTTGTSATTTQPSNVVNPSYTLTDNAYSFGVVVKPIKDISLFYSRNTTGGTMPDSLAAATTDPTFRLAEGSQKEWGIKTATLDGKLTASFSYFKISQENISVTNSDYYTLLAQGKIAEANALPPVFVSLNCKGWEFEMTYALSHNLTVVGNYSDTKIRQPITEVRLRGVPDKIYALYADYQFPQDTPLKGFGINVGVDYKSDVAGDNATGYTTGGRTLPDGSLVPNQPTFLVGARTLVNGGITYRAKEWTARLQVSNLLDKDYILAAGSRGGAIVGEPRNFKGSITYSF